jgi:hypothetical protein
MTGRPDVESGIVSDDVHESHHAETEALLPTTTSDVETPDFSTKSKASFYARPCVQAKYGILHITTAFVLGTVACLLTQYAICGPGCFRKHEPTSSYGHASQEVVTVLAPPYVGSTQVHNYPPTKPTNAYPSLFPSNVGYAGGTPTGAEAAVIETAPAYPLHTGQCSHQLLRPVSLEGDDLRNGDGSDVKKGKQKGKKPKFNLFHKWGNLSPWYSVERGGFGLDSSPNTPDTCQITGLHFLHRHGARYPTAWGTFPIQNSSSQRLIRIRTASYGGPAKFGTKLNKDPESWNASGSLDFLNDWYATLALGSQSDILSAFTGHINSGKNVSLGPRISN